MYFPSVLKFLLQFCDRTCGEEPDTFEYYKIKGIQRRNHQQHGTYGMSNLGKSKEG